MACTKQLETRTGFRVESDWSALPAGEGSWGDAIVRVHGPTAKFELLADVEDRLRPSTVSVLAAKAKRARECQSRPLFLAADHVSRSVGEALRCAGIHYADRSGNAFLVGEAIYLHVDGLPALDRTGIRRGRPQASPLSRPVGLKLVRALLRTPELIHESTRVIAERAGVSQPTVARVIRELSDEGWLRTVGRRRSSSRLRELHERWLIGYVDLLRSRMHPQRMRSVRSDSQVILEQALAAGRRDDAVAYGGPIVAQRFGADLRTSDLVIYVPPSARRDLVREHGLRPSQDGSITLLDSLDPAVDGSGGSSPLADAIDVHAELIAQADSRSVAAATQILVEHLRPRWGNG